MKILVADDDRVTRRMLDVLLTEWGYETAVASDGLAAWQLLQGSDPPKLAILLTVKGSREDIVTGLQGGADDYITKPFDPEELQARVHTGYRIVELQGSLNEQVKRLEDALSRVRQLHGLLPICCYCKNIRNDQDYWQRVDDYIAAHSDVRFTHGICPSCYRERVEPELAKLRAAAETEVRERMGG
jgi:phosphoserine phosphatase RsbU/P